MHWQTLGPSLPRGGNRGTKALGRWLLRMIGWRIEGEFPDQPKLIVAVVPHSSNIDWLLSIGVIWGLGLKASYLVKHSAFVFPLGPILRRLGGIPVDRSAAHGLVAQLSARFNALPALVLGITPEGTRGGTRQMKPGFALIAQAANVPVLPTILNYATRTIRFNPPILDVSDPEQTLATMREAALTGIPRRADA
jgi:1-acyl-sn-glycerol-3-phosphate acyltransferase